LLPPLRLFISLSLSVESVLQYGQSAQIFQSHFWAHC